MDLGNFTLSLSVTNLVESRAFYEKIGFVVIDGQFNHREIFELEEGQDWLIIENGSTRMGLFQGMFERNTLTFHPEDIRSIQERLRASGVSLLCEADESVDGPASAMLEDPDGNPILLDQS